MASSSTQPKVNLDSDGGITSEWELTSEKEAAAAPDEAAALSWAEEGSDSPWEADFEPQTELEDAPMVETEVVLAPPRSTPILKAPPSTPVRLNLLQLKEGLDTSDVDVQMPAPRIPRPASRGPRLTSAKRKESLPPKSASPAPKEVKTCSTPHMPSKKKIDWNSFTSKSDFLNATTAEMQLDAASREGVNVTLRATSTPLRDGHSLYLTNSTPVCSRGIPKTQIDGSAGHATQSIPVSRLPSCRRSIGGTHMPLRKIGNG